MSWLRHVVAGLSMQRLGSVHVGFVVDKMAQKNHTNRENQEKASEVRSNEMLRILRRTNIRKKVGQ
jgi:hypothetical protein